MAAAICAVHFIALSATIFKYNGQSPTEETSVITVRLVGSIVMALIAFLFVGLNVTRLKMSRDVLDAYLLRAHKKIRQHELESAKKDDTIEELTHTIDLIHTIRPMSRQSHFLLTSLFESHKAKQALGLTAAPKKGEASTHYEVKSISEGAKTARSPTNEAPASRINGIDLEDIIRHPIAVEIFKDSLGKSHNTELLSFYLDVTAFKRVKREERAAAAEDILKTYIQTEGSNEVNLAGSVRDAIATRNKQDPTALTQFQLAEDEVLRLLRHGDFVAFSHTEEFKICSALIKAQELFTSARDALRTRHERQYGDESVDVTAAGVSMLRARTHSRAGRSHFETTDSGDGSSPTDMTHTLLTTGSLKGRKSSKVGNSKAAEMEIQQLHSPV
jgi:hypothetical protein